MSSFINRVWHCEKPTDSRYRNDLTVQETLP